MTRISTVILICAFFARVLLNDYEVGPYSPGVYLVSLLLIFVWANSMITGRSIFRTREALNIFVIFLMYSCWVILNKLYNNEPFGDVFYEVSANHLFSLACFVVAQYLLIRKKDIANFVGAAIILAIISGFIAIMQWQNSEWAWNIIPYLRPSAEAMVEFERRTGFSVLRVSGPFGQPAAFLYFLISFGFFVLTWSHKEKGAKASAGLIGLSIISGGLFVAQYRVVIVAVCLTLPLIYLLIRMNRVRGENKHRYVYSLAMAIFFISISVFTIQHFENRYDEGKEMVSLERAIDFSDKGRVSTALVALNFSAKYPLIGGGKENYRIEHMMTNQSDLYSTSKEPHNLFLNAFINYGLPGLIFVVWLLIVSYRLSRKAIRLTLADPTTAWITYGAVGGLFANFIVAQFHSNGFTHGDTTPWWIIGILCSSIAHSTEQIFFSRKATHLRTKQPR